MPRKPRIDKIGFYYIINRGVAKSTVYHDDEDYDRFLHIMQEASDEYGFEVYAYALMGNHYHLLLKTQDTNLSTILQKINSRYSIYFNNKYKRVGPLWQGRFKSWYVYDEIYLQTLVRYVEFNPIKANMTQQIGEYKWAMSSRNNDDFSMLNYELIDKCDFHNVLEEEEQTKLDRFFASKIELQEDAVIQKKKLPLQSYFTDAVSKEMAINQALKDGFSQKELGEFMGLSHVAISKMMKIYKQKVQLFNKLRDKGIFWSYSKDIAYADMKETIFIEHLLKYGDFDDIKLGFELFGKRVIKQVWMERLKSDKSFIKINLLIARVFLGMDVESDYFKEAKNERLEKLRMLAS
jgi:putative transposase